MVLSFYQHLVGLNLRLDYIIAGGKAALLKAVENAEDDILEPTKDISKKSINSDDVIIGLAASGNTPLLVRFLRRLTKKTPLTIAISNNPRESY